MMIAYLVMLAATTLLAWVVAERRPEHRPIALLLSAQLAAELALLALAVGVLAPLRAELGVSVPWTGWARVAGHLADALWLVGSALVVAAALVVFAGRKPWPAFAGWACAVAALVVVHPIAGDGSQGPMLSAAQGLATVVSAGLFVAWRRRATKPATPAQFCLTMIVANELISLLGAWWAGPFQRWSVTQFSAWLVLGVLVLLQGRSLWTTRLSPSSS
jgi:hypothetical protein